MNRILNDEGMDLLFRTARTHNAWLDRPVSDATLHRIYDLMKWAPTSAKTSPARFIFLLTAAVKERLLPEVGQAAAPVRHDQAVATAGVQRANQRAEVSRDLDAVGHQDERLRRQLNGTGGPGRERDQ